MFSVFCSYLSKVEHFSPAGTKTSIARALIPIHTPIRMYINITHNNKLYIYIKYKDYYAFLNYHTLYVGTYTYYNTYYIDYNTVRKPLHRLYTAVPCKYNAYKEQDGTFIGVPLDNKRFCSCSRYTRAHIFPQLTTWLFSPLSRLLFPPTTMSSILYV